MQQNQRVKNDWFDCFSSMPSYSLISIGRRQRGQGSPLAWDDVCGSNRDYENTNARKVRALADQAIWKWDKKFRFRVARNRRLVCSR